MLNDEANHRFELPYFILNPGKTVTVHTGRGSKTSTELYGNRGTAVWNNNYDNAYLYDSLGTSSTAIAISSRIMNKKFINHEQKVHPS